ncbi:Jag N-terminal domain-containing protein [Desulfosarcina sp. OttesenSCG-928-A07]|nr:Jag N-terminal domain-containing protein [Desulfosarcina sp. OttesenSCG-928-G17]MDL2328685.1 Jag N-terminal domain-containing protein [Desulfosarcina sp. OttesenSCG-928-A07]
MSNTLEFEGKNLESALAEAGKALNIPVEQLRYEVLTYGSSGIFGLVGVKKARIRVAVKKEAENAAKKTTKPRRTEPKPPKKNHAVAAADTDDTGVQAAIKKESESAGQKTARSLRTELKSPQKSDATAVADKADAEATPGSEAIETGRETLTRIVHVLSEDAMIDATQTGPTLFFRIFEGNNAILIGKKGQTLEAIQYLVEKVVNKKNADRFRVVVDVADYLERREASLKQLARRMADKVKKNKKPVTIGQMNAHDRRVVHLHLKDEEGIRTHSVGEGYYRKLMIFPKKQQPAGSREKH